MYRAFFGLRERPFDLTPNPRFLVLTEAHREALSNLEYGIASRRGITLLLGDAGTGKTTIIRTALERQPSRVHWVHLHNPALSRAEFIEMLAVRFELSAAAQVSKTALLLELEALMRERHQQGESTVLIIDEAQSIPLELLEEIRLLANIETNDEKLLSVVLAGQPELAGRLNDPALRQLKQRIALRCELRPLTVTETLGYVAGRIAAAGGVGAQIFTREAVMLIYERSAGIPRSVSVIADNALLSGFALGRRPVSRAVIEEVCQDLDLRAPGTTVPLGTELPGYRRVLAFDSTNEDTARQSPMPQTLPSSPPARTTLESSSPATPAQATMKRPVDAAAETVLEPLSEPLSVEGGDDEKSTAGLFSNLFPKRRRFFSRG